MSGIKRVITFALITFFVTAMSGCGSENVAGGSSETEVEEKTMDNSKEEEMTQEHRFGETVIPNDIKRVVSIGVEDITYAMELPLVLATLHGENHYLEEELNENNIETILGATSQINYEAVLAASPDLIVVMDSPVYEESLYEELSKIAPTIFISREDWRKGIVELGELIGEADKAKEIVGTFEEKLAEAKETVANAVGEDNTVAFLRMSQKMAYFWFPFPEDSTDKGYVGLIYDSLGLSPDPYVTELKEGNPDEEWGIQLSLEKLPEIQADYIFVTAGSSGGTAEDYEAMKQELQGVEELHVWNTIPAVQNDHVYQVSAKHWMLAGPYADELKINDVVEALTE